MVKVTFEWDEEKDRENQSKHGVGFVDAQHAFADPRRVIAHDLAHSRTEDRFYCFGRVGAGIMTVCFTYRDDVIRIIGAGTGGKGRDYMKSIAYTNEPMGRLKVIPDCLPKPDQLAFREKRTKVTIGLSRKSIEFFKSEAERYGTPYQIMIRRLLDAYADRFTEGAPSARTVRRRAHRA